MAPLTHRMLLGATTLLAATVASAAPATVEKLTPPVKVTLPGEPARAAAAGETLPGGTRIETGPGGEARLRLSDGTRARLRENSDLRLPAGGGDGGPDARPASSGRSVLLGLGRLWTEVAVSVRGERGFEVRAANAVAGVRGTRFEVGVAGDGSVRVVVDKGAVAVEGEDEREVVVSRGREVQAGSDGRLGKVARSRADKDWDGWFSRHAFALEQEGLQIARGLRNRLDRRMEKVAALRREQKKLRRRIERLEAGAGESPLRSRELEMTTAALERVTDRLRRLSERVGLFADTFSRWSASVRADQREDAATLRMLAEDVEKVAAGFADLAEEGTDLSEEGLEDMLREMRPLQDTLRDGRRADEELFEP